MQGGRIIKGEANIRMANDGTCNVIFERKIDMEDVLSWLKKHADKDGLVDLSLLYKICGFVTSLNIKYQWFVINHVIVDESEHDYIINIVNVRDADMVRITPEPIRRPSKKLVNGKVNISSSELFKRSYHVIFERPDDLYAVVGKLIIGDEVVNNINIQYLYSVCGIDPNDSPILDEQWFNINYVIFGVQKQNYRMNIECF
jgi:hypothetical protein